ncbi:MAG: penicillin-binding protein 2 [Cyanobacteria bacterium J06632_22]
MTSTPSLRRSHSRSAARPRGRAVKPRRVSGGGPSGRRPRRASPRHRLLLVWGLLLLGMLGLAGKLAQLQLFKGAQLKAQAEEQQQIYSVPRAARRSMIDRSGDVLAVDRVVYTLYVHPLLFKQSPAAIAETIGELIERPQADLVAQFAQQDTGIKLMNDVPEALAQRIRQARLDGIELIPSQKRFYPQQALLSQLVGYINLDGEAQAGLEYSLQGHLEYPSDPETQTTYNPLRQESVRDNLKLQLTIDSRLQRVAQRQLEATVQQHGAKRGAVLVMDSRNGELLAMAMTPTYDPNRYYEAELAEFRNWVVSDVYEPGSTFKPINVAIALQEGIIGPDDYIFDEGRLIYDQWTIKNADYGSVGGRGSITITDILRHSSNVGMVHIMEKLDRAIYFNWLHKLGLGQPTGIELPAEAAPQLKDRAQFVASPVEAATTAFGQGFAITPLHLVQMHAALANGGTLVTPHVVRGLVDGDGDLAWQPDRPGTQKIFSAGVTQDVLAMMEAVVQSGSGEPAQVAGYRIGGKTGTSQKASSSGTYGSGRVTSFVSILPIDEPRYVVLAVIDEPSTPNAYGSTVAAPLVKTVIEALAVLEGVAPGAE